MREAFGSLRKAFLAGLEPEPDLMGADYLSTCHNARATEIGLRPHAPITSLGAVASWPFPQAVWTDAQRFDFYRKSIISNGYSEATDTEGGPWHVAVQDDMWVAANGLQLAWSMPHTAFGQSTDVRAASVCFANGALVIGGFDRAVDATLQRLLTAWRAHAPFVTHNSMVPDNSWVFWGMPYGGAGDQPYMAELALCGGSDVAPFEAVLLEALASGRIGMFPTGLGAIRCVKPLGNNAVVYGEDGIGILDSVYGDDGVTRFRWKHLIDVGIGGRGHVCGTDAVHYFLDTTARIWRLTGEGPMELGYAAYIEPLLANESTVPIIASFDTKENEAYFAAPTRCFVLRALPKGHTLSSRDDAPTSLTRRSGVLTGYVKGTYSSAFEIVSGVIDYNQRGMKSLECIEVAARDCTAMFAGIQMRYQNESVWRDQPWVPLNQGGACRVMGTAVEFRVKIKGVMGTNGRLDYAYHRWKFTDQRNVRGIYGQA